MHVKSCRYIRAQDFHDAVKILKRLHTRLDLASQIYYSAKRCGKLERLQSYLSEYYQARSLGSLTLSELRDVSRALICWKLGRS